MAREYCNDKLHCLIHLPHVTRGGDQTVSGTTMTSAYGGRPADSEEKTRQRKLLSYIPIRAKLRDETEVEVDFLEERDIGTCEGMLNDVIEEGRAWPFEKPLDRNQFYRYFTSGCALVVRRVRNGEVIGCFYVKPNFPERSAHVANGGFITRPGWRRRGVGRLMGEAFVRVAPDLGYRAALFNLVYRCNVASARLWRKLGFVVVGTVPGVGRLRGERELVDADMYYMDFAASRGGRLRRIVRARRMRFVLGLVMGVLVGKVLL